MSYESLWELADRRQGTEPTGKMRRLFDAASQLPRSQQEKIAAIIEPFIVHHAGR